MFMLRQIVSRRGSVITKCSRNFVSQSNVRTTIAEPLDIPLPEGVQGPANPKLLGIINEIAKLNLLEVSELSALLKKTLNLPDAPVMAYGSGPAIAAPAQEEEEEAAPKIIQTAFKVKLCSYDDTKKIVLIKELKNLMQDMNLVQAKKFIESAPIFVKEDIPKDEAEQLRAALEKVGAVVEIQ